MEKDYGSLSADQFRRLVSHLPEIRHGSRELPKVLRSVALAFSVMGLKDEIVAMSASQDPQEDAGAQSSGPHVFPTADTKKV